MIFENSKILFTDIKIVLYRVVVGPLHYWDTTIYPLLHAIAFHIRGWLIAYFGMTFNRYTF